MGGVDGLLLSFDEVVVLVLSKLFEETATSWCLALQSSSAGIETKEFSLENVTLVLPFFAIRLR